MTGSGGLFQYLTFYTLVVFSTWASAYGRIGERAERGFVWNLHVSAVTLLGNNSYFGESEALFGTNTDDWSEAVFELGFQGFMPLGKGTLFGALSGLYSKTWGNDASGLTADFALKDNWMLSGVFGWLVPGQAAKNWTGGDKTWVYGMIYISFSL